MNMPDYRETEPAVLAVMGEGLRSRSEEIFERRHC